ncbi:patatin [Saccharobesus litoralis]|uniref:Patatin n=1 Tax=Saccharobesus litoralis TaxID=2172099 RepID=A0A2S0VL95_9ALTE|nr:patatin-like phospholipase family protein [Saccharobesus litoralis]AWB64955.1 patatin [Saccharobesus litoralis]
MTEKHHAKNHIGLVLSGGGARAAYQVGVLKAISTAIPRNYGLPFPIVCGTSAGAINSTALACYASCYHLGVKKLEWVWKNFTTDQVYKSDWVGATRHFMRTMLAGTQAEYAIPRAVSLFNNVPLRLLLTKLLDFKRIDQNLLNGYLRALSTTASSYSTGESVCFFQADKDIQTWHRSKRRGQKCMINVEHLMASSAIPMIFPSIEIQHEHFGDGSLHQLAPLSPPVHLGADKILIIGLAQSNKPSAHNIQHTNPPGVGGIVGHLLDTIFNEALNADLERLQRINKTLDYVPPENQQQLGLKKIETMLIRPSKSFNRIAHKHYHEMPYAIKTMLRSIGINARSESSIVSYLLFEKAYTRELIELGFHDGLAQLDSIKTFLEIDV